MAPRHRAARAQRGVAGWAMPAAVFVAAAGLYVLASALAFHVPTNPVEAEACGFGPADFAPDGALAMDRWDAWWLAFRRQHDAFSALSVGAASAFVAHVLVRGRRTGPLGRTGAAAGGGLLALSALCVSCLAPVMAAVGLGVAASWLAGIPKWLVALNTCVFTLWGGLLLSRRGATCALPPAASKPNNEIRGEHP